MYKGIQISLTIPVYNESKHIEEVINSIPNFVDNIVVVEDASTDDTRKILKKIDDKRLSIIFHDSNMGVGQSTIEGHNLGIKLGADILVRIDGDGQMDIDYIETFVNHLVNENYHFVKGDRLSSKELYKNMPRNRIIGNKILTFLTRVTTRYWKLKDAQNGFTAIKSDFFEKLNTKRIKKDYRFENSLLFELNLAGAKIIEVQMTAIYKEETTYIKLNSFIPKMVYFQLVLLLTRPFKKQS